ncbi:MAG TPA: nuclear transport factor 2 family protein [Acidimicrobiales bacterium]|nr:nuclear transport factor 2 family protein [Acidimicrobiales bacterium]
MAGLSKDDTARLRELEDRAEITDIVSRYGDGVRRGDAASIAACFADDASLDHGHGQSVEGIEAIRQYFGAVKDSAASKAVMNFDEKAASTPVMSNVLIDLDGDTAHCESMCLAIHAGFRDGEGSIIVRGTRNIDDLVRTPEGWKIRKRLHPAVWSFEVPGTPIMSAAP